MFVKHSPIDSAFARSVLPEGAHTRSDRYAAYMLSRLTLLAAMWGAKGDDLDLPVLPGDVEPEPDYRYGVEAVSIDEMNARLGPAFTAHMG